MANLHVINSRELYADGAELQLLEILKNAKDVSSNSDELQQFIKDWPTDYHLNRDRNNILLPLEIEPGMKVLDVGGGTGVASRYVAEKGANVTLLEGELSRALVAQERCRDLKNVEIIVGEISDLHKAEKYDLILVTGVLEYIGLKSANEWLRTLRNFLNKDGKFALAIENRVGLKYFMGYPEDHTGKFWDGILDYYGSDKPRTYSKKELSDLLSSAGFQNQDWWYPFPDYKMPITLLSEKSFQLLDPIQISNLLRSPFQSAGSGTLLDFDENELIVSIGKSGLLKELSNSFLVICDNTSKLKNQDTVLYSVDPNYRKSKFRRIKRLKKKHENLIWEEELFDTSKMVETDSEFIKFNINKRPFFSKSTVYEDIKNLHLKGVVKLVDSYKKLLPSIIQATKNENKQAHINQFLPMRECLANPIFIFDIGLTNCYRDGKDLVFFDNEWGSQQGVCLELAITRALFYNYLNDPAIWFRNEAFPKTTLDEAISDGVREILGETHHSVDDFIKAESWFLSQISNVLIETKELELRNAFMIKSTSSPNQSLPLSPYAFESFRQRFNPVIELERTIIELERTINLKTEDIRVIMESKTYKIATILRKVYKRFFALNK
jgi:2-polyprenyl-3-methyl-5-hydroxy-6-metoxy-1,4-benzoquinol methylase